MNLALRASPLDIADDVLVIDAAKRAFLWKLRISLSQECRRQRRVRSFRTIVGGDSSRDDGLQLAGMIVGATRQHIMGIDEQSLSDLCQQGDRSVGGWGLKGIKRPRLSSCEEDSLSWLPYHRGRETGRAGLFSGCIIRQERTVSTGFLQKQTGPRYS